MGRISNEEIERLKQNIAIGDLVRARGVELKRHGADLLGLCPFHEDHDPSLVVSPKKNLWHCLGACRAGGSVIDWVMRADGVDFRAAVEKLRNVRPSVRAKALAKALRAPIDVDAEAQALLDQVAAYYHESLKETAAALAYLEQRGLVSPEMIDHFRIGFSNQTLLSRLPSIESKAGAELKQRLAKVGLTQKNGREHFMSSVVIPIFDEHGRVVEMYGRRISPPGSKGVPVHRYLPGPHRGVFNGGALAASKDIILCEALIDALTFWCAGFRNVTSSYGVEGFTKDIFEAMKRAGTERVFIAYDRDDAGDRAADFLAKKLGVEGIACFRVEFPKGMDANEYARKLQPAERALALVLRKARWMAPSSATKTPAPTNPYASSDLAALEDLAVKRSDPEPADEIASSSSKPPPATSTAAPAAAEIPLSLAADDAAPVARSAALATDPHLIAAPETISPLDAANANEAGASAEIVDGPVEAAPISHLVDSSACGDATATAAGEAAIIACASPAIAPPPVAHAEDPASTPRATIDADVRDEEVVIRFGDRRYRVRGLAKNLSVDLLKVNLLVARGEHYFVDTVDLYSARHREAYLKQAAVELGVDREIVKKDLGKILLKLEELQEAEIKKTLAPKDKTVKLTPAEHEAALDLLRDPKLLDRILADFERCGVVGEETNKLLGYLAAVSRKLEDPLAVIIQSSSAAGKSSLMEAILAFTPDEDRVKYSAMTGQSLFYMGETNLRHKILAIVEEEGAERASYALKLLQSERELSIASTGKDPSTGKLVTHEYHVEGPVMIFLTTTAVEIDDELLNRCIVLTVDEDRAQTQAIHRLQRKRETLEGLLLRRERTCLLALHQNAQRLLRPLFVANPYAERLTFLDHRTRTRRDHMKYLVLIRSIALLFQYQRELKTIEQNGELVEYIEAELDDIAIANRLAHEVLGRSLDELPPQTKRLLFVIESMASKGSREQSIDRQDYRFTRRDVREVSGWGDTQLKVHMKRLEDLEYLVVRGGRGAHFEYELLYDGQGQDGAPFLSGLIDVDHLERSSASGDRIERSALFDDRSGQNEVRSGTGRPAVGAMSGTGRHDDSANIRSGDGNLSATAGEFSKTALPGKSNGAMRLGGRAAEVRT